MRQLSPPAARRGLAPAALLAALAFIIAACATGPAPATVPSPTPGATATVAPSPTVPPVRIPTEVPTVRPTRTPVIPAVHPAATRTGNAQVDAVIDAFMGSSVEARRALVRFLITPCTTALGLGGPPKCAADQPDGTPVEVLPWQSGEGGFATRATIDRALTFDVSGLYGVFRVPVPAVRYDYWPGGDYGIVFTAEPGQMNRLTPVLQVIISVENGAVVKLTRTPYVAEWPPSEAAAAPWLLAPLP